MIIIMSISVINEAAAKKLAVEENCGYIYYAQVNKEIVDTSKIILLDLSENALDTRPSTPSIADYLYRNGLIKDGTSIKILFHDVDNTLPQFIAQLNEEIKVTYKKNVKVSSLTDSAYEYTIIKQNDNKWAVYGVLKKDMPSENEKNFSSKLDHIPNKTLLWEGQRIQDYSPAAATYSSSIGFNQRR